MTMSGERMDVDSIVQRRPELAAAVMIMDNHLHDDDLESLKFLCQGLVVASKLKRVKAIHELVSCLQSAGALSEDDFFLLPDLLQYIQRVDVLGSIGCDEEEVIFQRCQQDSKIIPFYILLYHIAEDLSDEDLKKAKYMYPGGVPRSKTVSSGLDLFAVMIQHSKISPADVSLLVSIFQHLRSQAIVNMLNRYMETGGESVKEDLKIKFRKKSLALCGGCNGTEIPVFRAMSEGVDNWWKNSHDELPFPSMVSEHTSLQNHAASFPQTPVLPTSPPGMMPSPPDTVPSPPDTVPSPSPPDTVPSPPDTVPSPPDTVPSPSPPDTVPSPPDTVPSPPDTVPSPSPPDTVPSPPDTVPSPPRSHCAGQHQNIPLLPVPSNFDERIISWELLNIVAEKVLDQYWPNFAVGLRIHLDTQAWDDRRPTKARKMALLLQWLQQEETQAMDCVRARQSLVHAIHWAGPTLLAQEIAGLLNVNIDNALQESMSSETSACENNETSSNAQATHIPEHILRQAASTGEVRDGQLSPMAIGDMAHLSLMPSADLIPRYRMDRTPRGICVILNNKDFFVGGPGARKMEKREGTDIDRDKLEDTFRNLSFLVMLKNNCTDTEMIQTLNQMAGCDHSQFDCFICCFLTHGAHGALYGTNGIQVPIRDLTSPFRSQACPSLAGKPKLFFMQACLGTNRQPGQPDIQRDCAVEPDAPQELIPNEADFLLGYATMPGFVSWRSRSEGSWYISKLTELLSKYAYSHDILDILTLVNYEVGQKDADISGVIYKQSPAPMYSLRKKLIFKRPT
ncbi:uncharacterized protein LOC143292555 [Babylonia areolata]|uniref:uncharacterized protein LOC143292555 n=1 Tax=Babylonia areolata TaxID=304850 RepID=UPI003FD10974